VTEKEVEQDKSIYGEPSPEDLIDPDAIVDDSEAEAVEIDEEISDKDSEGPELLFTYVDSSKQKKQKKKFRRRRRKDKNVVVATVISQILFTRSRWLNGFPVSDAANFA
jgi:hypothetical protein